MLFNSFAFLIFFPIVTLLYYLIPHKYRWIMLLIASYYFYMSWNPSLVFLIMGTTLLSYGAGLIIEKSSKKPLRLAAAIVAVAGSQILQFSFDGNKPTVEKDRFARKRLFSQRAFAGRYFILYFSDAFVRHRRV